MIYSDMFIRPCGQEDLEAILDLQELVFRVIPDENLLRRNTPELFTLGMTPPNVTAGVFVGETLIAVGILVDPKPPETDLRVHLKKFTVDRALDMKLVMVHPDFRGKRLQKALMWILEKTAYTQGCTHLCTSISPDNRFSYQNALSLGYQFDHLEELYGGLLRNVYVKEIDVAEFNGRIARTAERYEGTPYAFPAADLSFCMPGDVSLVFPGDVAEYVEKDGGGFVYGLLAGSPSLNVLLPGTGNTWRMTPFRPEIDGCYALKTVWLNTGREIPFPPA